MNWNKLGLITAVTAVLLIGCSIAMAQSKCHTLRALNTQTLAVSPTGDGTWYLAPGTTSGIIDWQEMSPYMIEYIPGDAAYPNAVAGRYWNFTQKWYFNKDGSEIDTFTVSDYHSSFPLPAGKAGMGTYNGSGKITGGTGIFEGVTGTVSENGPYLIWFTEDGWTLGTYQATYNVRICMR